jgi:hypothetical protein
MTLKTSRCLTGLVPHRKYSGTKGPARNIVQVGELLNRANCPPAGTSPAAPVAPRAGAVAWHRYMNFAVEEKLKHCCLALVFAGSLLMFGTANAADGCGAGCYATSEGVCVIKGWTTGAHPNECPVTSRPRPPCPRDSVWRRGGTGGCYQN